MKENRDHEREILPHDAHVQDAIKVFRDCGFTLSAMQYKRQPEALEELKRFNGVPEGMKVPFAWNYHPNEWSARQWEEKEAAPVGAACRYGNSEAARI
jgi:hypothetical protein